MISCSVLWVPESMLWYFFFLENISSKGPHPICFTCLLNYPIWFYYLIFLKSFLKFIWCQLISLFLGQFAETENLFPLCYHNVIILTKPIFCKSISGWKLKLCPLPQIISKLKCNLNLWFGYLKRRYLNLV